VGATPGEVMMKHLQGVVDVSDIAEPFASVIKKSTARDPKDRYETVAEMVEAVFGSEKIQASVSGIQPESLTVVAGRAARRGGFVNDWGDGSGGGVALGSSGGGADFGKKSAGEELSEAVQEYARVKRAAVEKGVRQKAEKYRRMAQELKTGRKLAVADTDALGWFQRKVLGVMLVGVVAIGAMILSRGADSDEIGAFVFFVSLVGIASQLIGHRWFGAKLRAESPGLQRLFTGLLGAVCVGMLGFPIADGIRGQNEEVVVGILIAALFLIDWAELMDPKREERISFGPVVWAVFLGWIFTGMFGGPVVMAVGTLAAMTLGIQVFSPWHGVAAQPGNANAAVPAAPGRAAEELRADLGVLQGGSNQVRADSRPEFNPGDANQRAAAALKADAASDEFDSAYGLPSGVSPRMRSVVLLMAVLPGLMGFCGIQRFVVGRWATGLLWFFTLGLFGFGQIYDIVMIAWGYFKDSKGRRIVIWDSPMELAVRERVVTHRVEHVQRVEGGHVGGNSGAGNFLSEEGWVMSGVSLILSLIAGILLAASVVVGGLLFFDLLGLIASGVPDQRMADDIREFWGDNDWPLVLLKIGFPMVLALMGGAAVLLLIARRGKGVAHMGRAVLGVAGMMAIWFLLGADGPSHFGLTETDWRLVESVAEGGGGVKGVVEVIDWPLIRPEAYVLMGLIFLGSVFVLAWPAWRGGDTRRAPQNQTRPTPEPMIGEGVKMADSGNDAEGGQA
jgi:hypothetical protein